MQEFLKKVLEMISVPPQLAGILEQKVLGNTVMQYGLYAVVLLIAWIIAFIASYVARKSLTRILSRWDEDLAEKVVTAVRKPIRFGAFSFVAFSGTFILTCEPTPAEPHAHWVYWAFHAVFAFGFVICLFWILSRVFHLVWHDYFYKWIEKVVKGDEKRFFPVIYKLLATALWIFAIAASIEAVGFDAVDLVMTVLGAQALHNTIGQYLAFLGLSLLTLLLARTVFNYVHSTLIKFATQKQTTIKIEESWFEGFQRPLVYLITLIGFKLAAAVLSAPPGEDAGVKGFMTVAIDVCLTADILWILFTLTDKIYEHFVVPLFADGSGFLDPQLLPLTRKAAKAGIGVVGAIFMIKAVGEDPGTIVAGLGVGGLAIGIAAKDTLAPFLSGLVIYATHPYRVGDYIEVEGGLKGMVDEIGMRATIMRTKMGTTYIVPNDKIINNAIHNTALDGKQYDGLYMRIDIGTVPAKRDEAIALMKQAVIDVEDAYNPNVHFLEYGSDNLGLMLSYWITDAERFWDLRHEIMMLIDSRMRDIGVEMSLPTSALNFHGYLPDGAAPTVQVVHIEATPDKLGGAR